MLRSRNKRWPLKPLHLQWRKKLILVDPNHPGLISSCYVRWERGAAALQGQRTSHSDLLDMKFELMQQFPAPRKCLSPNAPSVRTRDWDLFLSREPSTTVLSSYVQLHKTKTCIGLFGFLLQRYFLQQHILIESRKKVTAVLNLHSRCVNDTYARTWTIGCAKMTTCDVT